MPDFRAGRGVWGEGVVMSDIEPGLQRPRSQENCAFKEFQKSSQNFPDFVSDDSRFLRLIDGRDTHFLTRKGGARGGSRRIAAFANSPLPSLISFPGSAWERTASEALPRVLASNGRTIWSGRRGVLRSGIRENSDSLQRFDRNSHEFRCRKLLGRPNHVVRPSKQTFGTSQ